MSSLKLELWFRGYQYQQQTVLCSYSSSMMNDAEIKVLIWFLKGATEMARFGKFSERS